MADKENYLITDHLCPQSESDVSETFQPKTEFGRRLLALRRAYVESGGPLLDADTFERELLQRRGGVSDE